MRIKKEPLSPGEKFRGKTQGHPEDMEDRDRVLVMREKFRVALAADLDYERLRAEMIEYNVELPKDPDLVNLSEINRKYALAQSYLTRVSNIEMNAIYTCNLWHSLKLDIAEYIEAQRCLMLIDEDILAYPNAAAQQAAVRAKMPKTYALLAKVTRRYADAESFQKIVEAKKKDLASTIVNLKRQVGVMELEHSLQR